MSSAPLLSSFSAIQWVNRYITICYLTSFTSRGSRVLWKIIASNGYDLMYVQFSLPLTTLIFAPSLDCLLTLSGVGLLYLQTYCMQKILEAITEGTREARANAYIYALVALGGGLLKVSRLDV
jgi:hypothetical protein